MKLNNKSIDEWLKRPPLSAFHHRNREDFYTRYKSLFDYLNRNVYDQVTMGAHLKDPEIVLNDHGAGHVITVIEKATELVAADDCDFSAYEIYILLLCILLHDVGNVFGRYEHEISVDKIISHAEELCGEDTVEIMLIRSIVDSHGGKIKGTDNKDKISPLKKEENCLKGIVRTRSVASVLRFADELADDKRRASTKLLEEDLLPPKSKMHHAFSACLDNVYVKHATKTIELTFKISKTFATQFFANQDGNEILLLDEIYNRILKMHLERIYCMRFLKGMIDIEKISISIEFYHVRLTILPGLNFEISDLFGYPRGNIDDLFLLCEPLVNDFGTKLDGKYIKNKIDEIELNPA